MLITDKWPILYLENNKALKTKYLTCTFKGKAFVKG